MLKDKPIYDKRLVPHLIKRGTLSQAEFEDYLRSLPDTAAKSEPLVPRDEAPADGEGGPERGR